MTTRHVRDDGPVSEEIMTAFEDAIGLWRLDPGSATADVIDAATACLVDGFDTPALRELAGASPRESHFVLDPLIIDTVNELGKSELLDLDIQHAALGAMLRKMVNGRATPREVASWAYSHIGYDGGQECDPIVNMDNFYDDVEYLGYQEHELDEWMRQEAEAFLAGRPSPGPPPAWQHSPAPIESRTLVTRIRNWLRGRR